jgi:hypothetical protein
MTGVDTPHRFKYISYYDINKFIAIAIDQTNLGEGWGLQWTGEGN